MVEPKNTNGLDGGAQNAHSAEQTKGQRVMAAQPNDFKPVENHFSVMPLIDLGEGRIAAAAVSR